VTYERFEVVVVPFPFTDKATHKRRPAVVLSSARNFNDKARHSVMAMITSAGNPAWALDVPIKNLPAAGLPAPSVVRMKLFTLDHKFVIRRAGKLAASDQSAVRSSLDKLLG
jgi:mRNA interferase MazF